MIVYQCYPKVAHTKQLGHLGQKGNDCLSGLPRGGPHKAAWPLGAERGMIVYQCYPEVAHTKQLGHLGQKGE